MTMTHWRSGAASRHSALLAGFRFACFACAGAVVAALLFLLDSQLIRHGRGQSEATVPVRLSDFVHVAADETVRFRERRLPKKEPPPDRPPPVQRPQVVAATPQPRILLDFEVPAVEVGLAGGDGPWLGAYGIAPRAGGAADSDVVPIVRIEPQYPREALIRGIEGWVRVEFMILEDGSVDDVMVVEAQPARIFDRPTIRAVQRWKFRPRYEDGRAVRRRGAQTIEFRLDEETPALSALSGDTPRG